MFEIEHIEGFRINGPAVRAWHTMGRFALSWIKVALRTEGFLDFLCWVGIKISAIIFDSEGRLVLYLEVDKGKDAIVVHPFLKPDARKKGLLFGEVLSYIRETFPESAIEIHVVQNASKSIVRWVTELGMQKRGTYTPPWSHFRDGTNEVELVTYDVWVLE